jgi:mannose-1-phosphate guanylyltransferase
VLDFTPGLASENLILEPSARGTGPAMVLAMVHMALAGATTHDPVLVLRADAVVDDQASLRASLGRAMEACLEHAALIALATAPMGLENSFGWLGLGPAEDVADLGAGDASTVRRVLQVKVAPDYTEAAQYRDSGKWRWATGMLAFRHGYMGYVLGEVCDEFDVAMLLAGCLQQADMGALAAEYELMPALSFEESVLRGAPNVLSVELGGGWQRARSWSVPALAEA